MKISLNTRDGQRWQVSGSWPFTVLQGASVETGAKFTGVTYPMEATVPGSVYDDLTRAGIIENPYFERNSILCEWVANRFWSYMTSFDKPETSGKRVRLVMRGIDYHAHVFLNDKKIAEHVGMYTSIDADITDELRDGENSLTVVLENAPDEMGQIGYTSRTFTQKARFGYKWDFGTRLVNLGIYDDVFLDVCSDPLEDVHIRYVDGGVRVAAKNKKINASLSFRGEKIGEAESDGTGAAFIKVENPELWYPNAAVIDRAVNNEKTQPLYDLTVKSADDEKTYRIGLRTLEYRRPAGANSDVLPYVPVINGREIYIKGVNMTPLDHMYGTVDRERYSSLLRIARDAGVNLIRVWGGGIIEKEDFYDLCDEYGIMVWQEFIQSSSGIDNIPSKRREFLELCAKTADEAVRVKRNHTSLTYWSGGNELMDERGVPSTFDDENIAMLRKIVTELDPDRLMLPTSASGPTEWFDENDPQRNQDIHGPWKYEGVEGQYALYNKSTIMLHSEFGVDGMSNLDSIKTVLAPENQRVTTMGENLTWRHHGEWWDTYSYREKPLFGELESLETLVLLSQFMQAEGIRYAIEAHRRRTRYAQKYCIKNSHPLPNDGYEVENAGAIVWQINEPWPNVSCTSMVDYYAHPKLAMYFWAEAEKPLHVSLRYSKLMWKAGETFCAQVYIHDERGEGVDSVGVRAEDSSGRELSPIENGATLSFTTPEGGAFTVELTLRRGGVRDTNRYLFLVDKGDGKAEAEPVLDFVRKHQWKI